MSVHRAAAQGFQSAAEAYERGRPEYPPEAIGHMVRALGLDASKQLLDLGAGTGKLTRLLVASGAKLLAVEPVEAMRKKLAALVPQAEVVGGTAEAIPLRARSVDAVVAAQAFHWFEGARALAEIDRVLKPEGPLALVWNVRDETVDWVAQLTGLIDPYEANAPRYRTGAWRTAFERSDRFTPLEVERFHWAHRTTAQGVVDRVLSISFIASLPGDERQRLAARVHELLEGHAQLRDRSGLDFPYRTDVYLCRQRPVAEHVPHKVTLRA